MTQAESSSIGIDAVSFYTPGYYLSLDALAKRHGVDPEKFSLGIGQEKIALTGHDEDIVTMAAEAAQPLLERYGKERIDTVMFATETGIDQSKAASVYLHRLLGLPANCRNVELKHACYAATAAIHLACGHVARHPKARVLVVASDIARYDLDSSGEPTQGAGAVAMLVTANPRLIEIEPTTGCYSEDVMDFWRPNYRKTPLVDGKYSALRYLHGLVQSWSDYRDKGGRDYHEFSQFCYHLPFSRMAEKGHRHLAKKSGSELDMSKCQAGMVYNRTVGNCYSASLYLALVSTLENTPEDLSRQALAFFSYGSGAVSEFFSGVVMPGYRDQLFRDRHLHLLAEREAVDYTTYLDLRNPPEPTDGGLQIMQAHTRGRYRLEKIDQHKRFYLDTQ